MVTLLLSSGLQTTLILLVFVVQIIMLVLVILGGKKKGIGDLVDSVDTVNEKFDELSVNYEDLKNNNSDEFVKINEQLNNLTQRIEKFEASFSQILNIQSIDSNSIMEEPETLQIGNIYMLDGEPVENSQEKKSPSKNGRKSKKPSTNLENFEVEEEP